MCLSKHVVVLKELESLNCWFEFGVSAEAFLSIGVTPFLVYGRIAYPSPMLHFGQAYSLSAVDVEANDVRPMDAVNVGL